MGGAGKILKKGLGEMGFTSGGGNINWFPGHMAAATRAINARLKLADLVIEVRDSRVRMPFLLLLTTPISSFSILCFLIVQNGMQIPLSSANQDLQPRLSTKRRVIALNKKDLANPNIMHVCIKSLPPFGPDQVYIFSNRE